MPWEQAPKTEPSPTDESTVPPSGQTGGMSGTKEPPPNGPVHWGASRAISRATPGWRG